VHFKISEQYISASLPWQLGLWDH